MAMPRWYAVSTKYRHEKSVTEQLRAKSIEAFLPLVTAPSQWKDRRVMIDRPIFPGYVFIHLDLDERKGIYNIPGVVRMLSFNGKPAAIDESEIEAVRICLLGGSNPEPCSFLKCGERVRVKAGALEGLEGIVVRQKNQCRIVVSIALIHQSISAEVDAGLLEPVYAAEDPTILRTDRYLQVSSKTTGRSTTCMY